MKGEIGEIRWKDSTMKMAKIISTHSETIRPSAVHRNSFHGTGTAHVGSPCRSHQTRHETRQLDDVIERSPSFVSSSKSRNPSRSQPSAHWVAGTPIPTTAATAANVI